MEQKLGSISETSAHVPPDMAEMFFEVHEYLDEIRSDPENPPEHAVKEVRNAEETLNHKVKELESDLHSLFLEYDANPDVDIVKQLKEILAQRSYIKSFLRELVR